MLRSFSVIALLVYMSQCAILQVYAQTANEKVVEQVDTVDFSIEVAPILSDKCYFCHGPDEEGRQADLRLDVPPDPDATVIVAGDRMASLVWERINDTEDPMPPVESHKSLTAQEKEILGRWIDQGAHYEAHWAYAPITRPAPPIPTSDQSTGSNGSVWGKNEIDRFIYDKLRQQNLQPSPPAKPAILLRRIYLDLIGLPPTQVELDRFLADPSADAYAKVVEDLLASPRFGEHWAAWWLDLVRYADSVGFHGDQPRSVWPYRDWVINAFNTNMPFDEFSRLQLAGDLMQSEGESVEEKRQRLFASAYNRLGPVTAEGGAQQGEYRAIYAADRVSNFGEVWLASSTGCARCHDHKYDPFTATDFYSLAAVFEDIDHPLISDGKVNKHWSPFQFYPQNEEQAALIAEVDNEYHELLAKYPEAGPYQSWTMSRDAGPAPPHDKMWSERIKQLFDQRMELIRQVPIGLYTRTLPIPREVKLLPRGNWLDESGPVMQSRAPEFLGGEAISGKHFSRLDLANWLFEEENPLTSRVVVNRLWSRFFGRGLSNNTLDVGKQGEPPTHRELIDWLASEFRDNNWNMRHIMRSIVMSDVYQQSSNQSPDLVQQDPENKWLARQTAARLSAEIIRDQALAAAGLLVNKLGGPSVFPYQPPRHWDALNFPKRRYRQSHGPDLYRRSVYTWTQRSFPHPAMTVFDAPNRESCTSTRTESNTPLQALTLLNEPQNVECARKLAERVMLENDDHDARIAAMFAHIMLRAPSKSEQQKIDALFASQKSYFASHPKAAAAFCKVGEAKADKSLPTEELAAYASIGRVILNLHETVIRP